MKLQLATLVFTVLLSDITALPTVDHCLTRFETSLKEILSLKKSCAEANLRDCCQIAEASKIIDSEGLTLRSGLYDISNVCQYTAAFTQDIYPHMQARCNMDSGDGGWTVLLRRTPDVSEREAFDRKWDDYENGFGNLSAEFWYGLRNIHCLTSREPMEVEVEMSKTDGTKLVLAYGEFRVDGPETSYTLHVAGQKHEGHDYLGYHNGAKFSTRDRDSSTSCSLTYNKSGNWFKNCYHTYLTDMPNPQLWNSGFISYDYAELRVRPTSCLSESPGTC